MFTQYGLKRTAWLVAKIKDKFPAARTSDMRVFTIGGMIDHVKYLTASGHVYFDGLDMGIYDRATDNFIHV